MISGVSIAAMAAAGLLCIAVPVAAAIIFKRKNKDTPVSAFFIGCVVFVVFALILEQILHFVMLPIVSSSTAAYTVYGALAAGVFEESGRFIAFKTVMKKQTNPQSAVMYGLGHGGAEAILLAGLSFISMAISAVVINASGGIDAYIGLIAESSSQAETLSQQLAPIMQITIATAALSLFERIVTISFHTAVSVMVFESARIKGRVWLFTVCILLHALVDVPAALYQCGALPIAAVYLVITVLTAGTVYAAARSYKRIKLQLLKPELA